MAHLAYKRITLAGLDPAPAAASGGGDTISASDAGYLLVKNGGASPITVTVVTPGVTIFGSAEPDLTVSVPAAGERLIGPMRQELVNSTINAINITYSGVTSVTVSAITL